MYISCVNHILTRSHGACGQPGFRSGVLSFHTCLRPAWHLMIFKMQKDWLQSGIAQLNLAVYLLAICPLHLRAGLKCNTWAQFPGPQQALCCLLKASGTACRAAMVVHSSLIENQHPLMVHRVHALMISLAARSPMPCKGTACKQHSRRSAACSGEQHGEQLWVAYSHLLHTVGHGCPFTHQGNWQFNHLCVAHWKAKRSEGVQETAG